MSTHQPTREECIQAAAIAYRDSLARQDARTPRQAAEAAWDPGGPYTVDELEQLIIASRQRRTEIARRTERQQPAA